MFSYDNADTIAAIATPPGDGGIAIVRISGPQSFEIADRIFLCRGDKPSVRTGGTFTFGSIIFHNDILDAGLCLFMRGPKSFTGDDTVELQVHGGTVLTRRILQAAIDAGARLAEPGEFTCRAFLNGKMDLVQAEAVLDAIRAKTDCAARAAIQQLEGTLSKRFSSIYDHIMKLAVDIQASMDFPDEELPEVVLPDIAERLCSVEAEISEMLKTWNEGKFLRDGAMIVIAGRPNAGKSTLMNALLGKDRAIVSQYPGTTRDVIEDWLMIEGIAARLMDTAGLRDSECEIEKQGVAKAKKQLEQADLYLYVIDGSTGIHRDDLQYLTDLDARKRIIVLNKIDLGLVAKRDLPESETIAISLLRGDSLDPLRRKITERLLTGKVTRDHVGTISDRHRELLISAKRELNEALKILASSGEYGLVIAADQIREALEHLGRVTGRIYENELLNSIFSRFCIGK